jgi:uncharacterized membrane protein YdbT with pleckstrin-like domain
MTYTEKLLSTNEKILMTTHKHVFKVFSEMLKELLIVLIIIVVFVALKYNGLEYPVVNIGLAVVFLLALGSMAIDFIRWKSESYVVTNRRVIHARGILSKSVMDSSLSKINDVILEQSLLGRIFSFGTIKILTAANETINTLDHISKPVEFKQSMLNAKGEMEPIGTPTAAVKTATQLLDELEQLRARKLVSDAEFEEKRKEILKRM